MKEAELMEKHLEQIQQAAENMDRELSVKQEQSLREARAEIARLSFQVASLEKVASRQAVEIEKLNKELNTLSLEYGTLQKHLFESSLETIQEVM